MALGAALRSLGIHEKSYWNDEIATVSVIDRPLGDLLSAIAETESTPPLYYLIAWPWARLLGTGEIGLRSLSLVFSTAAIAVAYLAGRELVSRRVGLVAATLVAVNPLLVWYGQEARSYSLLVLLSGLSFLFLLRGLAEPSTTRLAAWGIVAALAIATHYFAVFLVAAEAAWLLARDRRRITIGVTAIPALTTLALVPLILDQSSGRTAWIDDTSIASRAVRTPPAFLVGFETRAPYLVAAVAALLAAIGVWLLLRRTSLSARRRGLAAASIGLAAVLVPLAASVAGLDYFFYRNVLAGLFVLLVALATGLGAERSGRLGAVSLAALVALSIGVVVDTSSTPKYGREDWRNVAELVGSAPTARAVVVTPELGGRPLRYYLHDAGLLVAGQATIDEIDVVGGATRALGSITAARPPRGPSQPAPAGFALVERLETRYATIVRYRASEPTSVTSLELRRLALDHSEDAHLLVAPAAPRR